MAGMAIHEAVRPYVRDGAQTTVIELVEEIDGILDVLLALRRIAQDGRRYQSPAVPIITSIEFVEPLSKRAAALKPQPKMPS